MLSRKTLQNYIYLTQYWLNSWKSNTLSQVSPKTESLDHPNFKNPILNTVQFRRYCILHILFSPTVDNLQRSLKIPRQNHVCKRLRRRCQPPFPTLIQIGEEEQKSPNRKGRKCGQKTSSMTGESWMGGGGGEICDVCSASGLLLEYRTGGRAMDTYNQPLSSPRY